MPTVDFTETSVAMASGDTENASSRDITDSNATVATASLLHQEIVDVNTILNYLMLERSEEREERKRRACLCWSIGSCCSCSLTVD